TDWHVWCSSNTGQDSVCTTTPVSKKPQLYVYWNDLPAATNAVAPLTGGSPISVESPELSVDAMPVDPNADSTRLDFQVSKSATSWSGSNLVADSDWINSVTWNVDAGSLSDGQTYWWRARSGDWCTYDDGSEGVCSNVDGEGVTHDYAQTTAQ